ncbi:Nucleoside-diphosphate-sugar pyrophosphorylase family protein [alpha proteobacterium HIMB114]|nr:Nucleoside-diphosphate-sugar pyrophosphorylase family protein [alpha proteobacterium HIMB114]
MIKNIFILVGGKGSRLKEITKKTPKPLIKINSRPFLDYILINLAKLETKKIYLLCCYKYKLFFKKYHNRKIHKSKIICIKEDKPLGTSGSLYNAKKFILNDTLVCNGDTYFDFNFNKIKYLKLKKSLMHMICIKNKNYKSNKKLNNLIIRNNIIKYSTNSKVMNAGVYIISKKIIKVLKSKYFSLEDELIPKLILQKKVSGNKISSFSIDIGTKKNLKEFKKIKKNS